MNATALKFTKAEIPATVSTRVAEPNPFDGHFPADDKALSFAIDGAADSPMAKKLTAQARKAAQAVDRTARVKTEQSGPKTKPVTTFTVWTIARVTRPRGGTDNTPATA